MSKQYEMEDPEFEIYNECCTDRITVGYNGEGTDKRYLWASDWTSQIQEKLTPETLQEMIESTGKFYDELVHLRGRLG